MYENIMSFKGTWRSYQQRVLDHFDQYKKDKKIHIVAAPGSGKTTLGIELIKRFDQPVLIFVPTIAIREQWVERIKEMLLEGIDDEQYISQDLKQLKLINVTTYQSLHSAMTQYKGVLIEDSDIESKENVDYDHFDLLDTVKKANIQTICLDECHHLRSEWWKALEDFKKQTDIQYTIALTATPPYDSQPQMWKRYINMCGEIDEEIMVPELVKEGSLCPHQDFVYFNYPTKEEEKEIKNFKKRAEEILDQLLNDQEFQKVIQSHPCLYQQIDMDQLLEKPAYLSSILIYLDTKNLSYPSYYQKLLGYQKLEKISLKWMEILLQGLLYDDTKSYTISEDYYHYLIKELKSRGLIEKKKVTLEINHAIENMLIKSVGKCESIRTIVFHEYECMKDELKLLILTDYIKKEYEKAIGDENKDVQNLGVLPFFEMLRRENQKRKDNLKLGVLCGSMMIIPATAQKRLLELSSNHHKITFHKLGLLDEEDYIEVRVVKEQHQMIRVLSQLFEEGYMHVLIGTKSLLGEGWDSPCVNTLILASFVGSFMLSNQMRGRAIRTYSKNPEKASHIWHLVCLNPEEEIKENSEDFQTLSRRMEHFLGLHYQENYIENGTSRLTAIHYPLNKSNIKKSNRDMLKESSHRTNLKKRWNESLAVFDKMEVIEENCIHNQYISVVLLHDAIQKYIILTLAFIVILIKLIYTFPFSKVTFIVLITLIYSIIGIVLLRKIFLYRNPLERLKVFGRAIYSALIEKNLLESENSCVKTDKDMINYIVYLEGGTNRDKALFSKCIMQFFDEIDNQRYILYNPKKKNMLDGYFVIPEVFSKRKEDALLFAKWITPFIGKYEVVYTRSVEGRKILLKARVKAFANREERCIKKKKVKGALE